MRRAFHLMKAASVDGCLVEFGVYKGESLCAAARLARRTFGSQPPMFGFDSFAGMPVSSVPLTGALAEGWAPGAFGDTSVDLVRRRLASEGAKAELVAGLLADVPTLERYGISRVRFAYVDVDIYEGYRDALRLLTPVVDVGTVILFDEVIPVAEYRGIEDHGQRAVGEWMAKTDFDLHFIRYETQALCVIVDAEYLKRHAAALAECASDTVVDIVRRRGRTWFAGVERE